MEKNSISIHFVQSALRSVERNGYDISHIIKASDIDPTLLNSPESRVSADHFSALWLTVARCLDDEFFGQDSHRMKVGSFAMLCRTLVHTKTLKNALVCMMRFFNLLLDDYHCSIKSEGQYSRIVIEERSQNLQPRIFGHETLLILQHGIICWLVGRRIPIVTAGFAYPEPSYSAEYHFMYSPELHFNEATTTLTFDSQYLDLTVIQNERTVNAFIRAAPANIVLKYKNNSSFSATIRKTLRNLPSLDWPDFDTFASNLNMTRSTLRRRLDEEGQPFQTIKDHLRRDLAIDALTHTSQSVIEIAIALGFAEPSAFHRAFKKWTNTTPGEYRQRIVKLDY
jgi:AraC-like DNA-binding protein